MKTAVVTLSVGQYGRDMLAISGPLLRAYADRIGAKFHVFQVGASAFPCGEKFRVRDAVAHYDRTIYLDADIILDPAHCPDLFAVVPPGHVAGHDDAHPDGHPRPVPGWVQNETDLLCDSQGIDRFTVRHVYNSGVLVLDREHARFFEPPPLPFPRLHCMEQWWTWRNVVKYGFRTFALPPELNHQWWIHRRMPTLAERPDIHIRHYAGMPDASERLAIMRAAREELEARPPLTAEPPAVRFCIVHQPRTGSTMLQTALNEHPEIICRGELLNRNRRHLRAGRSVGEYLAADLFHHRPASVRAVGFKACDELLDGRLPDGVGPDWKIVIVRRLDKRQQFRSWRAALASGYWQRLPHAEPLPDAAEPFDAGHYAAWCRRSNAADAALDDATAGRSLVVYYEDLVADWEHETGRVMDFLGVERRPVQPTVWKSR